MREPKLQADATGARDRSLRHSRMSEARTGRGDCVPRLETATTAHRLACRARRHRGATIRAAHDLTDLQAILVPVDSLHDAAIAVALPRPDADFVSHRSSRSAGTGPAQQGCKLGVTLAFGGFKRSPRAPIADVEICARRNQQLRDLHPPPDGPFDQWRSPPDDVRFGSAPAAMSMRTASRCPAATASMRGRLPLPSRWFGSAPTSRSDRSFARSPSRAAL